MNDPRDFRCICGSGDDAEFHSLMCVASNTPDDEWYSERPPDNDSLSQTKHD